MSAWKFFVILIGECVLLLLFYLRFNLSIGKLNVSCVLTFSINIFPRKIPVGINIATTLVTLSPEYFCASIESLRLLQHPVREIIRRARHLILQRSHTFNVCSMPYELPGIEVMPSSLDKIIL